MSVANGVGQANTLNKIGVLAAANKWITGSKTMDRFLIVSPLWIPVIFYIAYQVFAEYQAIVFLLSILLFSETHFGSTWFFFFDQENKAWIKDNYVKLIIGPILIVFALVGVAFGYSLSLATFLSSVFSGWHVTRQSVGILKIYGQNGQSYQKFGEYIIYLTSFWFLFVGFLRFYSPFNADIPSLALWSISIFFVVGGLSVFFLKGRDRPGFSVDSLLTLITGMAIYFPYLFVERTEHAVSMGVGMHFMQYLALTASIYYRKRESLKDSMLGTVFNNLPIYLGLIFVYSGIMVFCRNGLADWNSFSISFLYLIPLSLQTIHYYVDMFVWRFSNPHIRQSVGKHLFSK